MGITYTRTAGPKIEPDTYPAVFKGAEAGPEGQYGPSIRWKFDVFVEDEVISLDCLSSTNTGAKAKATRIMTAILGRQPEVDENLELDDLKDRKCRVEVDNNAEGYATVVAVKAAKQ